MKREISISVVVTALNERENISECLLSLHHTLKKSMADFEIIFVDDGSTDGTFEEASRINFPELKIIRLAKNAGTGFAVKEGLRIAQGEWYCWFPSDLEIMPDQLAIPLNAIESQDIVITYFSNAAEVRTRFRHLLSLLFLEIVNLTFSRRLRYINGVTLIRRKFLEPEKVKANGFFFHAELLLRALSKTDKFSEVAIGLGKRKAGKPKAIKARVLYDVLISYSRILWEIKLK